MEKEYKDQILELKEKMKWRDLYVCISALVTVFFVFIENEIFLNNRNISSVANHLLRSLIIVFSIVIIVFITQSFKLAALITMYEEEKFEEKGKRS